MDKNQKFNIAVKVLKGQTLLSQAEANQISVRKISSIVHNYCRRQNEAVYVKALIESRQKHRRMQAKPSLSSLRDYMWYFL
jgi:hypothetical protein